MVSKFWRNGIVEKIFTLTDLKTFVNKKENIITKIKDTSQAGKMFPTNAKQVKRLLLMQIQLICRKTKNKNLLSSLPWLDLKTKQNSNNKKGINSRPWKEQEERLIHGGKVSINLGKEDPKGKLFDYSVFQKRRIEKMEVSK